MPERYAALVSTGIHLPEREVSNDLLRERFPEPADFVDKMEASTGIRRRWWAPDDQATSDLALYAAQQALENAGRRPEDVDLIILGTDSPDYLTPATSVVLQAKLGAKNAGTFDVGCACASFPTGFATAAGLIASNPAMKTVLVVGVYLMHRLTAPDDPMVFFYGDGAGAAVLEPSTAPMPAIGGSTPAARPSRPPRNRSGPAAPRSSSSSATPRRSTTKAGRGSCGASRRRADSRSPTSTS
jgi:3-oxoacyl-[acyl-carrier-protein] synthase III